MTKTRNQKLSLWVLEAEVEVQSEPSRNGNGDKAEYFLVLREPSLVRFWKREKQRENGSINSCGLRHRESAIATLRLVNLNVLLYREVEDVDEMRK